jgi:hypothetical protein
MGLYAINISTAATAISLLLSTTVLFLGPRVGMQRMDRWSGIVLIRSIGSGNRCGRFDWSFGWLFPDSKATARQITGEDWYVQSGGRRHLLSLIRSR